MNNKPINSEATDNQSLATNQELIHYEVSSDESQDEAEDIIFNIEALSNSSNFSKLMKEKLRSLMKSQNSLRIDQDYSGWASIFGVLVSPLGGQELELHGNVFDLTPEIYSVSY